jgi:3-dehydroquinate synthase
MVFAGELSTLLRSLDPAVVDRMRAVLAKLGLPVGYRGDRWPQLLETMRRDKKARGTILRFVLLDAVGSPVVTEVPDDAILFSAYQEIGEQSPTTRLGPVSL